MKANHHLNIYTGLLLLTLVSCPLFANDFGGSASVLTGQSDNAAKSDVNKMSERQDEYQLNIKGDYTNAWVYLDGGYEATSQRFAKESQEDKEFLEGNASLLVGKSYHPAELLITHTRKTLLSSPDNIVITNNQDEREIITINPTVRTRLGKGNRVFLTGTATNIRYLDNGLLDSTRNGATVGWARSLSPIQSFTLTGQQTDVEFENFPGSDYVYKNTTLVYNAWLRNLSYTIRLGHNKSEPEIGEPYSSPTFGLTVDYKKGFHEFMLESSQVITDTSQGGNNAGSVNSSPNSDGARANQIDQIELLNSEFRWTTFIVCERCDLSVTLYQRDEDYLSLEQSAKSKGASVGFNYRFSKSATLSVSNSKNQAGYTGAVIGNDYALRLTAIEYKYSFVNDMGVKLLAQQEKRTSDSGQHYVENYFGGGLDYTF